MQKFFEKSKFMVCGNGKKVKLKDLNVNIYDKDNYNYKTDNKENIWI